MQGIVAGKEAEESQDKMGVLHHGYVWYDGSNQSGRGQASISQRRLGIDVLTRVSSTKKKK